MTMPLFALLLLAAQIAPAQSPANRCPTALAALETGSMDARERGAWEAYQACDPEIVAGNPNRARALEQIANGSASAAAVLLLGHFRDAQSQAYLESLASGSRAKRMKLGPSAQPVDARLPASVALGRRGSTGPLIRSTATSNLAEAVFLLSTLREIAAPEALKSLARTLTDTREVSGGVPSHAQPQRRLCDAALDAFAQRLSLKLSFPLTPSRRYTNAQLEETRAAIAKSL